MIFLVVTFICIATYNPTILGFNLSNFLILSGYLFTALKFQKITIPSKKNPIMQSLLLFIICIIGSIFLSNNWLTSIRVSLQIMMLPATVIWIGNIAKTNKDNENIWKMMVLINFLACMVGVMQTILKIGDYHLAYGADDDAIRLVGAFPTPNIYASFLCLTLPAIILKIRDNRKYFVHLVLNMFILYRTYSRSSILFTTIAIVVWAMINACLKFKGKIKRKTIIRIVLVIGAIGCTVYRLAYNGKLRFLFKKRYSNEYRVSSIFEAMKAFSEKPFGRGIGIGINGILDGTFFNVLVDTGLIGMIVLIVFMSITIKKSIFLVKTNNCWKSQVILLSTLIFWMLNLLENILYDTLLSPIYAIIIYEMLELNLKQPAILEEGN